MMKRKLLAVALPLVSAMAIVGSGFAAWNFQSTSVEKSKDIGVIITDVTSALGEFKFKVDGNLVAGETLGLDLVLDQGGYENKDVLTKGISIRKPSSNPVESWSKAESLTVAFDVSEADMTKYFNAGLNLQISTTLTLANTLNEYITYNGVASNSVTYEQSTAVSYSFTYDIKEERFAYKEGKKPTTKEAYDTMAFVLQKQPITIAVKAELLNRLGA